MNRFFILGVLLSCSNSWALQPTQEPDSGVAGETVIESDSEADGAIELGEESETPVPTKKFRGSSEKKAEGTKAKKTDIKPSTIKSQYRTDGRRLDVDPD